MTEQRASYCNLPWGLTVNGNPIPKGRPRVYQGRAMTPARTREYETLVSQAAGIAWRGAPTNRLLSVTLRFYRANCIRCDIDNLTKAILDALNGVVWEDDGQIVELRAVKGNDAERPRVEITVDVA